MRGSHSHEIVYVRGDLAFPVTMLKTMLPDVETALFFAQLYNLDSVSLGILMKTLFNSGAIEALTGQGGLHSHELQDYLVEIGYEFEIHQGNILFGEVKPKGEILPAMWLSLKIEIASSIQAVAEKLKDVVSHMPGKHGEMAFKSMMMMNAKRPTIGDHKAFIQHQPAAPNLVVLDVSGSMSEPTIQALVDDVVALSWEADAHLAIVSNTTTFWAPGEFSVRAVLDAAEYGGTQYETLSPLFTDRNWGIVVTIADYDSSRDAKYALSKCNSHIDQVLDISLVTCPTYLSECVGQLADEVKPLMVAADDYSLR
jgi:hypothetical protein